MKTHCPQKYTRNIFIASVKLLYHYLSTEQGLSEWFADKVDLKDGIYHFSWGATEQKASLFQKKKMNLSALNGLTKSTTTILNSK